MRRYHHILLTSDASESMVLKSRMQLDEMTALGMLTKVSGIRDGLRAIREAYGF
jgi:Mg-chelatase subunit ChlD